MMILYINNVSVLAYFLWETLAEIAFLGATHKLRHTSLVQIQPLLFSGPVLYCFFIERAWAYRQHTWEEKEAKIKKLESRLRQAKENQF